MVNNIRSYAFGWERLKIGGASGARTPYFQSLPFKCVTPDIIDQALELAVKRSRFGGVENGITYAHHFGILPETMEYPPAKPTLKLQIRAITSKPSKLAGGAVTVLRGELII